MAVPHTYLDTQTYTQIFFLALGSTDRKRSFRRQGQHDGYRQTDKVNTIITDRQGHPIITDRQGQRNYYRPAGSTRLRPKNKVNTNITDGQGQHEYYQQADRPNTNITDIRTDTGSTRLLPTDQKAKSNTNITDQTKHRLNTITTDRQTDRLNTISINRPPGSTHLRPTNGS